MQKSTDGSARVHTNTIHRSKGQNAEKEISAELEYGGGKRLRQGERLSRNGTLSDSNLWRATRV